MLKKYDIVAKVGTYTKNGEEKNRYKNVGVIMEKEGRPFILMDRTFNPAGISSDRDTILLSLFEPKDKDGEAKSEEKTYYNPVDNNPHRMGTITAEVLDDEVPF